MVPPSPTYSVFGMALVGWIIFQVCIAWFILRTKKKQEQKELP